MEENNKYFNYLNFITIFIASYSLDCLGFCGGCGWQGLSTGSVFAAAFAETFLHETAWHGLSSMGIVWVPFW